MSRRSPVLRAGRICRMTQPAMTHPLKVAVQMDPIETINIDGDSSFQLMLAAQARGAGRGSRPTHENLPPP